jgi:purine-nucleoside phosphorylase
VSVLKLERLSESVQEAAGFLRSRLGVRASLRVGLVLGSGLGSYADRFTDPIAIEYREIPHFAMSQVVGHAGRLVIGERHGATCAVMQGRVHYFEGHSAATVAFPVRVLIALGARELIITNAAGGIGHGPGTLMLIEDHINLLPDNPLRGGNDERLGPRFPDMTHAYCPKLRELARVVAAELGIALAEGVYAAVPGPSYETPAEIRMLKTMGADAVGMSTVPEVIAANHMGARVLGISCITNLAAGLSDRALCHDEVTETAARVRSRFEGLLDGIVAKLADSGRGAA